MPRRAVVSRNQNAPIVMIIWKWLQKSNSVDGKERLIQQSEWCDRSRILASLSTSIINTDLHICSSSDYSALLIRTFRRVIMAFHNHIIHTQWRYTITSILLSRIFSWILSNWGCTLKHSRGWVNLQSEEREAYLRWGFFFWFCCLALSARMTLSLGLIPRGPEATSNMCS